MKTLVSFLSTSQALVLGVVTIGCATAGLLTGHLDQGAWLGVTGGVGAAGSLVTTAHVVGTQVNAAAGSPTSTAPGNTGTAGQV